MATSANKIKEHLESKDLNRKIISSILSAYGTIDDPETRHLAYSSIILCESEDDVLLVYTGIISGNVDDLRKTNKLLGKIKFGIKDNIDIRTSILEQFPVIESEWCSTCRVKNTVVSRGSFQVRSADEGDTTFLACKKCGKRWKNN